VEGAIEATCKPHSPGAAEGLIETNALKGLIVLHEPQAGVKVPLLEVTPVGANPFVMLKLGKETRSECSIGGAVNITGKVFFKDCQSEGEGEKKVHLVEENGPLSALLYGAEPALLDGSANDFLVGTHTGLEFSGIPG
jgi:hypothetical protein